jgi:hypothetical protein
MKRVGRVRGIYINIYTHTHIHIYTYIHIYTHTSRSVFETKSHASESFATAVLTTSGCAFILSDAYCSAVPYRGIIGV